MDAGSGSEISLGGRLTLPLRGRDAARLRRLAAVGLLIALAEGAAYNLVHFALVVGRYDPASDYRGYYEAARIGLERGWSHIYDPGLQCAYLKAAWPNSGCLAFVTTPPAAFLAVPVSLLPPQPGYLLFVAMIGMALVAAAWLVAPARPYDRALYLLFLAALVPAEACLVYGQVAGLVLLSVVAAWKLLSDGRPVLAGIVLAGIMVKPHIAIAVPLVLVIAGRWRAVAAWAVASGLLAALSLALIGTAGLHQYLALLATTGSQPADLAWSQVPVLNSSQPARLALQALLLGAVVVVALKRAGDSLELPFAAALVGSLAAANYQHASDFVLYAAVVWLVLRAPLAWPVKAAACLAWLVVDFYSRSGGVTLAAAAALLGVFLLASILPRASSPAAAAA